MRVGECECEVVVRTLLFQIRRRERENDAFVLLFGRFVAGVTYRGADPVACFFNRLIGETNDREVVQSAREVRLNANQFRAGANRLRGKRLGVSMLRRRAGGF